MIVASIEPGGLGSMRERPRLSDDRQKAEAAAIEAISVLPVVEYGFKAGWVLKLGDDLFFLRRKLYHS